MIMHNMGLFEKHKQTNIYSTAWKHHKLGLVITKLEVSCMLPIIRSISRLDKEHFSNSLLNKPGFFLLYQPYRVRVILTEYLKEIRSSILHLAIRLRKFPLA